MGQIGPGEIINNRYQLDRQIGVGGMATVWAAHDRLLGRQVAVKILSDRYASDPDFVERFRREASAAASLSHPNIVAVYDRGEASGRYYIVMEFLPGPDLKQIIRKHGRLQPVHSVDAALQILAALGAAHRRDLIHRDIKPQNVLISADGHLKVTDFGIARAGDEVDVTEAGSVIGTAQYLSPEQARGADVTTASDCYAVGVVLYEMLTGRVPFDGDRPVAVAMRQVNETPVAPKLIEPSIPDELNDIVMKALEKRPSNRFRTAEEFTQALTAVRPMLADPAQHTAVMTPVEQATQVIGQAPVEEPRTTRTVMQPGTPVPPPPPARRRRWTAVVIALAILLAGGLALALFTDIGRGGVTIPTVAGLSPDAATTQLVDAGLTVSPDSQTRPDATIAAGLVVDTDPPGGSRVDSGTTVRLIVSSGPQKAEVPDVRGKTRAKAAEALTDAGFEAKFTEAFSSDVKKGLVVEQTPAGGTQLAVGQTVTVVISKGRDMVKVPSMELLTRAEAEDRLRGAGLVLGNVTTRVTSAQDPGTVISSDPAGGVSVERGSSVNLVVAVAQTIVFMPNLIGLQFTEAMALLADQGLTATSSEQDSIAPAGEVISQDPSPGTDFDPATRAINIVVSSGTPPSSTSP